MRGQSCLRPGRETASALFFHETKDRHFYYWPYYVLTSYVSRPYRVGLHSSSDVDVG